MLSLLRATQVLLGVNLAVSIYTTWYLFYNNGTAELMEKVRDVGPRTLPGSNEALKTTYVGIGWIDNQLTLLTLFFWETVDGARPAASLFSFMFAGQGAAAWTILSTEGRRFGNHWKVVSFLICWGLAIQMGSFAVFMPLYALIHLATSPTVSSLTVDDYTVDISVLQSIPFSLVIGYALPAVLLALPAPSVLTYDQKQTFIASWQVFPVWVEILQQLFSFTFASLSSNEAKQKPSWRNSNKRTLAALRFVYLSVLIIAGVTRITTVMLSWTSRLLPKLFAPEFQGLLDPSKVFQTQSFFASRKMNSIGEGAFQFLQYDEMTGSSALVFWSVALYFQAYLRTITFNVRIALKAILAFMVSTAFFGPCGSAVCFIWARDELIFDEMDKHDKKID